MSLHPPPHQSLRDTQNALQACVTRRKCKLAELYNVTLAVGSHPRKTPEEPPQDAQSPGCIDFLQQNDIERGRYFDQKTLPITPRFEWSFSQPTESHPTAIDASVIDGPDQQDLAHVDGRSFVAAPRATTDCRSNMSTSDARLTPSAPEQASDALESSFLNTSPQVSHDISGSRVHGGEQSGKDDIMRKRSRLPPDKSATPHSPPYTSDDELHVESTSTSDAQHISRKDGHHGPRPAQASILVPGGTHHEPKARTANAMLSNTANSARSPRSSSRIPARGHDNRPPSPSSTVDPRSSDTSRAEGRSSATSPDDDEDDSATTLQCQNHGIPLKARGEQTQLKRQDRQGHTNEHDTETSKDVAVQTSNMVSQPITGSKRKSQHLVRLEQVVDNQKRRRTGKRSYTAVMSNTKASGKHTAMVRSLQSSGILDTRVPSTKKDYMHLLFLRQALDSTTAFRADLSTLLNSSNKTLGTSDWQTSLQEKQDCTIIKRIYDLQQTNRWSLRQMKSSAEPNAPVSHQDFLVKEMRWLQTDFREERKLKLFQAQQMAHSCSTWYHASRSERAGLQVRTNLAILKFAVVETEEDPDLVIPQQDTATDPIMALFASSEVQDWIWPLESSLDRSIANRLPLYDPDSMKVRSCTTRDPEITYESLNELFMPISASQGSSEEVANEEHDEAELPPEEATCALFLPEWKPLRARVNLQWAFKPPSGQMPPAGFYENRRPSQWTPEDDQQLRQFAKDFPSNWNLISERLTPRSSYISSSARRTPWECYERLISMEGASTDPGTRQYAKQFQSQMDKIRMRWSHLVQQQLQAAQNAGQQAQVPRFPVPIRVERKSASKRFPALVDAARKVARKRESSEANRRQTHHEGSGSQGQMPVRGKPEALYTPQHWSNVKYKQQVAINAKQEQMRQQQRAMMAIQRGSYPGHGNNQTLYSSGIAQRMGSHARNSDSSGAPPANGHLAVPMANPSRAYQQQQGGTLNGVSAAQQLAQLGTASRPQMPLPGQERSSSQYNGSMQMNEQSIQQLMQQAQQQSRPSSQYPIQRPPSQSQFHRNSSGLSHINGDPAQSPRPGSSMMHGSSHGSPDMSHQVPVPHYPNAGMTSKPQSLSGGQVPAVVQVQHHIMQQNPGMMPDEFQRKTNQELKSIMDLRGMNTTSYDRSRQNAINAAAGIHSGLQQSQQSLRPQAQAGPQSPYLQQPQLNTNALPQQQQGQSSPYAANRVLPQHYQNKVPVNASAMQHNNKNYAQQIRQQQASQQMRHAQNNGMANPSIGGVSMRPPTSGSSGNGFGGAGEQQRPGTAGSNGASGVQGQLQGMGVPMNANGSGTLGLPSQSPREVGVGVGDVP